MKIAFDIDGVLADNLLWSRHVSDWDAFIESIPADRRITEGIEIVEGLCNNPQTSVVFITGRPESARTATELWLSKNIVLLKETTLTMRNGPDEPPALFKLRVCKELSPGLVFEDDEETARLLVDNGFKVMLFLRKGKTILRR